MLSFKRFLYKLLIVFVLVTVLFSLLINIGIDSNLSQGHIRKELKEKEGTIDLPIYRPQEGDGFDSIKRVVDDRGQRSITHYKVLESFKGGDIVECLLETGRTHQIRVHLSHLGHPIYGDFLYGDGDEEKDFINRQALHAYGLDFKSPRTEEPLSLRAELPDDLKQLIEKIK